MILKVGIILHLSSLLSWPTFNPLKKVVDHLALTLLSVEDVTGSDFLDF